MAGSDLVRSLVRGLDILYLVSESDSGVRLGDIAAGLGVKTPTAHNLLRSLSHRGFIEKRRDGSYEFGPAINELLNKRNNRGICRWATEELLNLGREIPEAIFTFCELSGDEAVVRSRVSPDRPGFAQRPSYQSLKPYVTASGLLFQAFASPEKIEILTARYSFEEHGIQLWGGRGELDKFLNQVRELGYLVFPFKNDYLRVAVPIFSPGGEVVHCLGINIKSVGEEDKAKLIKRLRRAADELSDLRFRSK